MRAYELLTEAQLDEINRRDFLKKAGLATMGAALGTAAVDQGAHAAEPSCSNVEQALNLLADYKAKFDRHVRTGNTTMAARYKEEADTLLRKYVKAGKCGITQDMIPSFEVADKDDKLTASRKWAFDMIDDTIRDPKEAQEWKDKWDADNGWNK